MSQPPTDAPTAALGGIAISDALCRRIEGLAAVRWGSCALVSWAPLNSQSHLRVARASLALAGGTSQSVIVKFPDPGQGEDSGARAAWRRYANELATYELLMGIRDRFSRFPALLARDGDLALLEDLGAPQSLSFAILPDLLTETLIALHRATQDFAAERLPTTGRPDREHSFRRASEILAEHAWILARVPTAEFLSLPQAVWQEAQQCGPVMALQHADLADLRQTIWRDPCLFLIDFEHARLDDVQVDLAVALLGKAEILLQPRMMLYNRLPLPVDFPDIYRRRWCAVSETAIDGTIWDRRLTVHLIVEAFCNLDVFYRAGGAPSFTALAKTQKLLLSRLLSVVPASGRQDAMVRALGRIVERIA